MLGFYCGGVLTLVQPVEQFSANATLSQGSPSFRKCKGKVTEKLFDCKPSFSTWFQYLGINANLPKPNVLMLSLAQWYRSHCNISVRSPQSIGFNVFHHTGQQEESGEATRKGGGSRLSQLIYC